MKLAKQTKSSWLAVWFSQEYYCSSESMASSSSAVLALIANWIWSFWSVFRSYMRSFRTAFSYLFSQTSCALASVGLLPVAAHPAEATFGLRRWHVASSVKKSYSSQRVICRASLAYCEQINGQVRNCAPNLISTDLFTSSVVYCREIKYFWQKIHWPYLPYWARLGTYRPI